MKNEKYFVGLDIGTNSIGYAVVNPDYTLCRHRNEPMWGTTLFEDGLKCDTRRGARSARRRLNRRQMRVKLITELFCNEIANIDKTFFIKLKESSLFAEDRSVKSEFEYEWFKQTYQKKYKTIHHLLLDMIENEAKFDIRLVYIACAWLVAHRGHFLFEINDENIDNLTNINPIYEEFEQWFYENDYPIPWQCSPLLLAGILSQNSKISDKEKQIYEAVYQGKKPVDDSTTYPLSKAGMIKLLCGGSIKADKLFLTDECANNIEGSIKLSNSEELENIINELGENGQLLRILSKIFDCCSLLNLLSKDNSYEGTKYISRIKVLEYEAHKKDLKELKYIVSKYAKDKYYDLFRNPAFEGYSTYSGHYSNKNGKAKTINQEIFYKTVKNVLGNIADCNQEDKLIIEGILLRIDTGIYMPKQVNTENRLIPHQLYYAELKKILENAEKHYGFLTEKDNEGLSVSDKIKAVFKYRIPYFVGPLTSQEKSKNAWVEFKNRGRIYPWNFENMVDFDKSEQAFIARMTNTCTYLPMERVLPKNSLLYTKFMVLNTINNIKIVNEPLSVNDKQKLFNTVFLPKEGNKPTITYDTICSYLLSNGLLAPGEEDTLNGIDKDVKLVMRPFYDFYKLLTNGNLSENDVENIIEHSTYTESKLRFSKWLKNNYTLSESDLKYVSGKSYSDFGRLSSALLNGIEGISKQTGEIGTVMHFLWNTNDNLMQILFDENKYDFKSRIEELNNEYYEQNPMNLNDKLDSMGISNGIKRPIFRAMEVLSDIEKVKKCPPYKVFVEMARDTEAMSTKGKRTKSRKDSLMELYRGINTDETKELIAEIESFGDDAENKLKSETLYLYFAQMGKCMYCGKRIEISELSSGKYNVDHIWPQSYIKDDSIHNNKVLVHSKENADKGNEYPIKNDIRAKMSQHWKSLHENTLINDEKHKRLIRATPFTPEEKAGFINRQIVETRQTTKVITKLLQERYGAETEIVFVKAGLVSDFRNEYGEIKSKAYDMILTNNEKHDMKLVKCRSINDTHHAKDAYLNVVVGNVYNERFSSRFFEVKTDIYDMKCKNIFAYPIKRDVALWNPTEHLATVDKIMSNNHIHITKYQTERNSGQNGGFFDQNPVPAKKDLIPIKRGLDVEKYGGYNSATISFFTLVGYTQGKKKELSVVPIDLMVAKQFKTDDDFRLNYIKEKLPKSEKITLPFSNRILKINTVFSLDGFEICLSGKSGGGLVVRSLMSLYLPKHLMDYAKKIEKTTAFLIADKTKKINERFDGITKEGNLEFFEYLAQKINSTLYQKMPGISFKIGNEEQQLFVSVPIEEQVKCLSNLILCLKTNRAGECNLEAIGKSKRTGAQTLSANISNWKYNDIRIIDRSASGLFESRSINLKELL